MFLLLDIGGTKTRVALSKDKRTLENLKIIETPQDFEEGLLVIKNAVDEVTQDEIIKGAVVGVPGLLNPEKTMLESARNLPDWSIKPLKSRLLEFINAPLFIENDAALNGLGEAVFGAGKGFDIVGFYTISTGLGGSRIVKQSIDENGLGFEPGKQIVDFEGDKPVILEDKISGAALEKRYGKAAQEIVEPVIWDEVAKNLAVGVNNALVFWSPQIIVLGGSVMKSIDLEKVKKYAKEFRNISNYPSIKKSALGDESGLYGALAYLNSKTS